MIQFLLKMHQLLQTPPSVEQARQRALLLGGVGVWLMVGCADTRLPIALSTPPIETPTVESVLTLEPISSPEALPVVAATPALEIPIETEALTAMPETPGLETLTPESEVGANTSEAPVNTPEATLGQAGYALRFFGAGSGDIDRVKISLDDPATNTPALPPILARPILQ